VEEGLPLVRAANTGISAGFDARGHELDRLGLEQTGFLSVDLPPALPPTFYSRAGLLLPGCAAALAMFVGLVKNSARKRGRISF
jgi:apolipoprotein N-acyltransferase